MSQPSRTMRSDYYPMACPNCSAPRDEVKTMDDGSGGFTVFYRCHTKVTVTRKGMIYRPAWTMHCMPGLK